MTEGYGGIGRYDPFEETGDWPFREAPPRPAEDREEEEGPSADVSRSVETAPEDASPMSQDEPEREEGEEPVEAEAAVPSDEELAVVDEDEHVLMAADMIEEPEEALKPAAAEALPEEALPLEALPQEDLPPEAVEVAVPADLEEHAAGELSIPPGIDVVSGGPHGFRRSVAVVVSRFNGDITTRLLESALTALEKAHVSAEAITVVPVPGAFELPLAALALAKTRRYSCIVALGCVIRGETPHFDLVSSEAASGLQLAAIETGIPVSFGVLACETREQAEARVGRAAEAVRTALEMADLFSEIRTRAASA